MKGAVLAFAGLAAFAVAGCGGQSPTPQPTGDAADQAAAAKEASGGAASVGADLLDASNQKKATATATQAGDTIQVRLAATAMAPGTYAAHVHTTGTCAAPSFESAGSHWNPTGAQHGRDNPAGAHKGDLPNLTIGADGTGNLEFAVAGATISGGSNPLLDADGAAVLIHAQADDYRTDPSGNAGGRIACGVLRQPA